jgi:hypothetical protein
MAKRPWQKKLDELKAEATAKTDRHSARELKDLGDVLDSYEVEPLSGGRLALDPKPEKLAQLEATQAVCTVQGWFFILSRYEEEDGRIHWHLSAALHPKGRGSSEKDWRWLGTMSAYLGAPRDPFIQPEEGKGQLVEDPTLHPANRPVHWNWVEESN